MFSIMGLQSLDIVLPGDPPSFESFQDPQDQFVYETDADNNPVSLKFTCPANGTDPEINWCVVQL